MTIATQHGQAHSAQEKADHDVSGRLTLGPADDAAKACRQQHHSGDHEQLPPPPPTAHLPKLLGRLVDTMKFLAAGNHVEFLELGAFAHPVPAHKYQQEQGERAEQTRRGRDYRGHLGHDGLARQARGQIPGGGRGETGARPGGLVGADGHQGHAEVPLEPESPDRAACVGSHQIDIRAQRAQTGPGSWNAHTRGGIGRAEQIDFLCIANSPDQPDLSAVLALPAGSGALTACHQPRVQVKQAGSPDEMPVAWHHPVRAKGPEHRGIGRTGGGRGRCRAGPQN